MDAFHRSHFLRSGGKKARRARVQEEPRAGVISDLQLSPSVSAAKKLPFSLVLSSSMPHVAGSEQEKSRADRLPGQPPGDPHDNSNPLAHRTPSLSTWARSERAAPAEPQARAHALSPCQHRHFKQNVEPLSRNLK